MYQANYAFDGNLHSQWASQLYPDCNGTDYVYVDLGNESFINEIKILWGEYEHEYYYAEDFVILGSNAPQEDLDNDENWTEIASYSNNTKLAMTILLPEPVSYRYVKVTCNEMNCENSFYAYGIKEFEIFQYQNQ